MAWKHTGVVLFLILPAVQPARAQEPQTEVVPANLRPLLSPPQSRMRIVVDRYRADRQQLDRFYATPMSGFHLARLKRFDLDWHAELDKIEAGSLGAEARAELQELKTTIRDHLRALDDEFRAQAGRRHLVPFAPTIVELMDARRRLDPMEAEKVAATLDEIVAEIAELRAAVTSGELENAPGSTETLASMRNSLRNWFDFYNAYDPMYSWWVAAPFTELSQALESYGTQLAGKRATGEPQTDVTLAAAAAPEISDVPDLARLLATPQNEMAGVLQAFRGGGRGNRGRGGRGNRGGGRRRGGRGRALRTEEFYVQWLAALETLDFDSLSRPAQVSYIGLRHDIEVELLRRRTPAQETIPHVPDGSGIEGRPIGRTALTLALADEMMPYTPEEIIALGDAEYAWCMEEMLAASQELGYGDDWRAAMEHVKTLHVPPGGQPQMIRGLMFEAVDFIREHDLITVPQVASETLRMNMMSPERQRVNPFFTGGSQISVSFPTSTMSHQAKLQSMRGNNIPFSRATVHHELIPGHNLQGFVNRRYSAYQTGGGNTPFYSEGWAVYWEMLLYRMGFPRIAAERSGGPADAENRIGFLFWRMHRSARITFSLRFHMGEWSAQQCIDFLVDGVGHERENAIAEVRRSFEGSYGPLYQAAYLLGAVQFRKLHEEIVQSGKMSEKDFHDATLRFGGMPVALVRLLLNGEPLSADMSRDWKFYGERIPANR